MRITKQGSEAQERLPYLSRKEKFWLAIGTVATAASAFGIFQLAESQQAGIKNSLTVEAEAQIPGFDRITGGGETPQTIFGEVHSASAVLDDGTACDFQYETYGNLLGMPNRGRIVSLGTCAVVSAE